MKPLKYAPAGGPVIHAVWGNKGIINTMLTVSLSVFKTQADPRSCQLTNVFKGGTDNLKYNQGDRCVFWRIQSRDTHRWTARIDGVLDDVIFHPGPLFRAYEPISSASKNISAAQGSQMCPSKGTASLPQGPALPKNTLPPLGSLPAMTGWCRDGRAQFTCLGLVHFWRTIPASELGSVETSLVTSLQVSFTICPIPPSSLPYRFISQKHSAVNPLDAILHFRARF